MRCACLYSLSRIGYAYGVVSGTGETWGRSPRLLTVCTYRRHPVRLGSNPTQRRALTFEAAQSPDSNRGDLGNMVNVPMFPGPAMNFGPIEADAPQGCVPPLRG